MKKSYLIILFCFFLFTVYAQKRKSSTDVQLNVNWKEYLSRHDMVWDTIPADYFEGPFVGNGLLGAILFKDNLLPNTLRFEIGRSDVYDHRGYDLPVAHYRGRLPIGQLLLSSAGEITAMELRTDLWNAEIRGKITTTMGMVYFRCFVPSGEDFLVLNIKTTEKESAARCFFRPQQAISSRYLEQPLRDKGFEYLPNPPLSEELKGAVHLVTQPLAVGDDYATAWQEKKINDSERLVLLTVSNRWAISHQPSTGSAIDAISVIHKASQLDLRQIEKKHREWWHLFYQKSFVDFPDPKMESFFWIQQYKLGSATRSDKPVIDLMGPWYKSTVWPCLWMNLNVQLTYYTTGVTNHMELEDPLFRLLERHQDQLIMNVPEEFRDDCSALGNPVGFDDLHAPVFLTTDRYASREMNIIVLPWLMHQFYLHNRRSMDDERLKNTIFPMMKRAYQVYMRILYKGEDGRYHLPLTFSDEYGKAEDASMNIALAKWGFRTLIDICKRLSILDPMIPLWKDRLDNMVDYHVNENGIMIGRDQPFAKPHRHYSHMLGLFPLYETNLEKDSRDLSMLKKTVQHFTALDGDNCMYKFSGASSIWSSLGEADSALTWVKRSLEIFPRIGPIPKIPTCTPNTLYCERGNPTFESPISSSRAMLDMLIQDWGGVIRIFPATPDTWKDASLYQMRAQGAFMISASRIEGKIRLLHVKSLVGGKCILQTDFSDSVRTVSSRVKSISIADGRIEFEMEPGEEVVFYEGKRHRKFRISPIPYAEGKENRWGVKKRNYE